LTISLVTPENFRRLERRLYVKAKAEPDFCFYQLYDKIYRRDVLFHAYRLAHANQEAPRVDGQTFAMIAAAGLEEWLSGLREELRTKTYKPQPVRRVLIPKPGGGKRPLGTPTIRDRVVQTAVKLVIEPIFEADLKPAAYGYRPQRSAQNALKEVHTRLGLRPGPAVDGAQKTRGGAAYLSGLTFGPAVPGTRVELYRLGKWRDAALAGMEEALHFRGGDPQGIVQSRHAASRQTDHGKRVVVGPSEAPWPFTQKEVEEMSGTASSVTTMPYGVKMLCPIWEQPRSSYYVSLVTLSRCVWPQSANGGRRSFSLTPSSWNRSGRL
jgi:hypothetical protein